MCSMMRSSWFLVSCLSNFLICHRILIVFLVLQVLKAFGNLHPTQQARFIFLTRCLPSSSMPLFLVFIPVFPAVFSILDFDVIVLCDVCSSRRSRLYFLMLMHEAWTKPWSLPVENLFSIVLSNINCYLSNINCSLSNINCSIIHVVVLVLVDSIWLVPCPFALWYLCKVVHCSLFS